MNPRAAIDYLVKVRSLIAPDHTTTYRVSLSVLVEGSASYVVVKSFVAYSAIEANALADKLEANWLFYFIYFTGELL